MAFDAVRLLYVFSLDSIKLMIYTISIHLLTHLFINPFIPFSLYLVIKPSITPFYSSIFYLFFSHIHLSYSYLLILMHFHTFLYFFNLLMYSSTERQRMQETIHTFFYLTIYFFIYPYTSFHPSMFFHLYIVSTYP